MMRKAESLEDVSTHFAFGRNWADYAKWITEDRIAQATTDLQSLVGEGLAGRTMIDVGCGSGLHSLAALKLGARHVRAVDLDTEAVHTTCEVLRRFHGGAGWSAEVRSVFDLDDERRYDIVYSWGVLHHTGSLWDALDRVSRLVTDEGLLAVALYARTRSCSFWRWEKRVCSSLPRSAQFAIASIYSRLCVAAYLARGRNPVREIKDYDRGNRA